MRLRFRQLALCVPVVLLGACSYFGPPAETGKGIPAPPPKPAKAPVGKPVAPKSLQGMTPEQVISLIGHPASETRKALGAVWLYRSAECSLSLAFFPEVETKVERVLTVELQGGHTEAACLGTLVEQRGRHAP